MAELGHLEPLPLLSPWMLPLFAMLVFLAGISVIVFWRWQRRVALWVLFASCVYIQGADYFGAFAYNRIYIAVYFLLATGPCLKLRSDGTLEIPIAMVWALQASVVVVYIASGIAKAFHGDWLKYSDVLWSQVQGIHRTELAALMLRVLPKGAWAAMQHGALVFELAAPLLFFCRWTRFAAIGLGIAFHLMIAMLMSGLIYLSLQMMTFYVLFLSAGELRFWQEKVRERFFLGASSS
jgi:hypothetical protein